MQSKQQATRLVKCPNGTKCQNVCVSSMCESTNPFMCNSQYCQCKGYHNFCKVMNWNACLNMIFNYRAFQSKGFNSFCQRVDKVYKNILDKIQRQKRIFCQYVQEFKYGEEYGRTMHYLRKRQYKNISPKLLGEVLEKVGNKNMRISYEEWTLNQMKKIDSLSNDLLKSIQTSYKTKMRKNREIQFDTHYRNKSVVLTKQSSYESKSSLSPSKNSRNGSKIFDEDQVKIKIDLDYPKTINSKLLSSATSLNNLLKKKIKHYNLIYRASEWQFSIDEFYHKYNLYKQRYDFKNPKSKQIFTVLLLKTEHGKIIGGCTNLEWRLTSSTKQKTLEDEQMKQNPQSIKTKLQPDFNSTTFLFTLSQMQKYNLLNPNEAIYCGTKSIGFGKKDLRIVNKAEGCRKSYCGFPDSFNYKLHPYLSNTKSGMQLCGGRYSRMFKVVEWELFHVEL